MTQEEINDWIQLWTEENYPIGKALGFPECCIHEFCQLPPQLLTIMQPTQDHITRYNAAVVNGEYTGFIPCAYHAKLVISGACTLESLIKDRSPDMPPFPYY